VSFEPVTRWVLRCDGITGGITSAGQCNQRHEDCHPDDDPDSPHTPWWPVLYKQPALGGEERDGLRRYGWLVLSDGRVLCPRHVTALEYLAHAALDGLPFDDTHPAGGQR
jgi:hypothetical protein